MCPLESYKKCIPFVYYGPMFVLLNFSSISEVTLMRQSFQVKLTPVKKTIENIFWWVN